ncbi:DNA ligase 4 [Gracilaria domingensis]|nr:DNA ligase 4 [Gracilaria domingensis]
MKETKLADTIIKSLDLVKDGDDAQWLKHYKEKAYRPERWKHDPDIVDGNLPSVLKALLSSRCPSNSSLTIGMVWNSLDILSQTARRKSHRIGRVFYNANQPDKATSQRQTDRLSEPDELRYESIRTLLTHGTAIEVAEVSRIILKELDIRVSEDTFLNWFHPAAKQHYTQMHDIQKLLEDCHDPKFEIGDPSVRVGNYASVMLTMRPSKRQLDVVCNNLRGNKGITASSTDAIDDSYFIMEPKLDGERMQLHKWRMKSEQGEVIQHQIRTFSRRGNDSSAMYAEALRKVVLSAVKAKDIILDGEIMIWNKRTETWLRFEDMREVTTFIAKKSVPEGLSYILKYMVFDVLYIVQEDRDGAQKAANMVMKLPLYQRRQLLNRIIQPKEEPFCRGVIAKVELVEMEKGQNETELIQALQRYERLGYEGVIAKHPDRPYALAERNINIAIKLKPDYFDGGIQDLDCLILGARFSDSHGHRVQRAGRLSSFLIGVRAADLKTSSNSKRDEEWVERMKKTKWIPVGSIGTGYADSQLAELQDKLKQDWKDFNLHDLPEHFERREYTQTLLSGVAKWIQPWNSVVVTITAYELNRRVWALRFPRVRRINWEKPYYDVPTFDHLKDLDDNKKPPMIASDENDVDEVPETRGKRKRKNVLESDEEDAVKRVKEEGHIVTGGRNARILISAAAGADVRNLERKSTAFEGVCCHVVAENQDEKEELEMKIHELGGTFSQTVSSDVDFVICSRATLPRIQMLKDSLSTKDGTKRTYSILRRRWVDESHGRLRRMVIDRSHVVRASEEVAADVYKVVDRFGDHWDKDADENSIARALDETEIWTRENPGYEDDSRIPQIEKSVSKLAQECKNIFSSINVIWGSHCK